MVTRGADKSLAQPGRKQATATEDFDFHISYLIIIIGGILVLFIYVTRLASNEIFSPSNKIH
jgi:TRAP-type C4-dicarboxylate transport system permease small subunit